MQMGMLALEVKLVFLIIGLVLYGHVEHVSHTFCLWIEMKSVDFWR